MVLGLVIYSTSLGICRDAKCLLKVVVLLAIISYYVCDCHCPLGNFEEHGHCFQCHASCSQCDSYDSCIKCSEGYTSKGGQLCEYQDCEHGKFFSPSLDTCIDCQDSCLTLCAYQDHCIQCPSDKILNLSDLACVNHCNSESQILIKNPQLRSMPVCRDFEYYINPNSQSPVELGTQQHPYKDIQSAFVEIMNFHSHSDRNVTVFVMEGSTVFASSPTYFVNMTHVQIESYSDRVQAPRLARMVGVIEKSKLIAPGFSTKFNILVSQTLLHDQMIFENSKLDSDDKTQLLIENAVFKPFHAGLLIKNFRVVTQYDDPGTAHAIFEPYRIDTRVVGMVNCDLRTQGTILKAITTVFNWHMENIVFETQHLYRLSLTRLRCGEDHTDMGTRVYFKNVTSINSGGKAPYLHNQQSLTRNYLANNAHFEDCHFDTYLGFDIGIIQFVFYVYPLNCQDQSHNTWNFTNFHLTTSRNEPGKHSKFSETNDIALCRLPNPQGNFNVHINNFTVINDSNNKFGHLIAWYAYNTTFYIDGARFYNSSGWMINFIASKNITLKNVHFENVRVDTPNLSFALAENKIVFDGVILKNVTDTKAYSNPLLQNVITGDSKVSFTNVVLANSTILDRRAVFYASASSQSTFLAENIHIENFELYGDTAFVGYGIFKQANFTNIHALRTYSRDGGENFLIKSDYSSEGLAPDNAQIFKDILVEQSTTQVVSVSKPDAYIDTTQSLLISNVTYRNSLITFSTDLIKIYKMATVGSYSIEMSSVTFTNLTFQLPSNLMHLQQQLKSQALIINLTIADVVNAGVTVQAYESNDFFNYTRIKFTNFRAINIDGGSRSLINIYRGADIEIIDSNFSFIGNYHQGAVLSAGKERAVAVLTNCTFFNNTSVEGAVFEAQAESNIVCRHCTFYNNFAIAGGVIKINGDGMFKLYNATIYNNVAMTGAVAELFSSQLLSVIDKSKIFENYGITKQQVEHEILMQNYIFDSFRSYLTNNSYLTLSDSAPGSFKIVLGKFAISNSELVYQTELIHGTGSSISISNSSIGDITLASHFAGISECDFSIINTSFDNIFCENGIHEVFHLVNTYLEVDSMNYTNSNCRLVNSGFSQLNLKNLHIKSVKLERVNLMTIFKSKASNANNDGKLVQTAILDSSFENITIIEAHLISVKKSEINQIKNTHFVNISSQILKVEDSRIYSIDKTSFKENLKCLYFIKSVIDLIHSSTFESCGEEEVVSGGAIRLVASNSTIFHSHFLSNKAKIGASISVECDFEKPCTNTFINLVIEHNVAAEMGGGIYYNLYRPNMKDIKNFNNSAQYGPNIASYAVRVAESKTHSYQIYVNDIPSGLKYENPLHFEIEDYDHQVMNLISSVNLKILSDNPRLSVKGTDFAVIKNGKATFDNLIFKGEAGLRNNTFKLKTISINKKKINKALGNLQGIYNNFIDISFRHCKPGEIETAQKQCDKCQFRSYTLGWNSTNCNPCMDYATCMGEAHIDVDSGYWRKTTNSSLIVECPNRYACEGGYNLENSEYPVKCREGYKGILCSQCAIVDGVKYQPLSEFQCSKCPNPALNVLRILIVATAAFCFLLLLIYINLRKKKESEISILLRILTNYIHLIAVSLSFNVKIPQNFTRMFSFFNRISSPNETFFSFDCFIEDYEIKLFAPSNSLFKMSLYIILPFALIGAIIALFCAIKLGHIILHYIKKECMNRNAERTNLFDFKRALIVSMICIIFLFHPAFTVKSLSIFLCTEIDQNDSRMTYHMEYKCYSWDHIKWIMIIALPLLVIWVIGLPIIALCILIKSRKHLESSKIHRYFLMLYQGFRKEVFYWEFVNLFRKFAILSVNSILNLFSPTYKIMVSVVLLNIFYYTQKHMSPYKLEENNKLDLLSITMGTVTLFSGIIFSRTTEAHSGFFNLTLLMIFILNSYFILRWIYQALLVLEWTNKKYLFLLRVIRFLLCTKEKKGYFDQKNLQEAKFCGQIQPRQKYRSGTRILLRPKSRFQKKKRKRNRRYKKKAICSSFRKQNRRERSQSDMTKQESIKKSKNVDNQRHKVLCQKAMSSILKNTNNTEIRMIPPSQTSFRVPNLLNIKDDPSYFYKDSEESG
ncbi:unnamed protein product [Moneuplotes crassus]|uniref:Uncharacterized protein n=1 Tax=Euplotes crassus TaxID=5936 RepID=A0AAD1XDV1_EUPCR|nr:unnamed protein product [Moneuplotes crassus]